MSLNWMQRANQSANHVIDWREWEAILNHGWFSVLFTRSIQFYFSSICMKSKVFYKPPLHTEWGIHWPTGGDFAHVNCSEASFFTLYRVVSSKSLFENRSALTIILEWWCCRIQKAVPVSSAALCSGSLMHPKRQIQGRFSYIFIFLTL